MTPVKRARRATDAAVRAAWNDLRSTPYAEDGNTIERALRDAGAEVFARFSCADPAPWLIAVGDALLVVGTVDDGSAFAPFEGALDGLSIMQHAERAAGAAHSDGSTPTSGSRVGGELDYFCRRPGVFVAGTAFGSSLTRAT